MSTTTLSQRLRALASTVHTVELIEPLREMAAMAEAQEAKAGELSDERITELGKLYEFDNTRDRNDGYSYEVEQQRIGYERALRYARDHGYLRPSQAIGEQTPVAWCVAYDGPGPNEGRRVHSNPTMHKLEAEDLAKRTGLVVVSLYPSPISSEARDKAIEAGNAMSRILAVTYSTMPYDIRKLIARWDQALSALSGE